MQSTKTAQAPPSKPQRAKVGPLSFDKGLFAVALFLMAFGLLVLLSASVYESERLTANSSPDFLFREQALAMLLGLFCMVGVSLIDYRVWRNLAIPLLLLAGAALLAVAFSPLGISSGGSRRWLRLGAFSLQPSEFAKLAVIVFCASHLTRHRWQSVAGLFGLAACFGLVFLVLKQPDLGTAVVILLSIAYLLLCSEFNLLLAFVLGSAGLAGLWFNIQNSPYQFQRLTSWLNPEKFPLSSGWNLLQAQYAIALGGLWGVGYGNSIQKLGYLPVSHADFIFAVICEELGLLGALIVICSFLFLLWKGLEISLQSRDDFGRLLGIGITLSICTQTFFNLAGCTGLLPVTGMTLPFISHGKTSVVVLGLMLGILLNLSKYRIRAI